MGALGGGRAGSGAGAGAGAGASISICPPGGHGRNAQLHEPPPPLYAHVPSPLARERFNTPRGFSLALRARLSVASSHVLPFARRHTIVLPGCGFCLTFKLQTQDKTPDRSFTLRPIAFRVSPRPRDSSARLPICLGLRHFPEKRYERERQDTQLASAIVVVFFFFAFLPFTHLSSRQEVSGHGNTYQSAQTHWQVHDESLRSSTSERVSSTRVSVSRCAPLRTM